MIKYPESGIILENYISEKRSILKWLKTIHNNEEVNKILNVELWVDKDFNKLEILVENFIKLDKNNNYEDVSVFNTSIHSNDEDFIIFDDGTCGFHKYQFEY